MIQLFRIRTAETITLGLRGSGRKKKAVDLLKLGYQLNFKFKSSHFKDSYWSPAKIQLKKESFGKCAYCEAPTETVAHGDVEHFRPKSIYWWLVYCYENYSYACQICNQSFKSNKFQPQTMQLPQLLPSQLPDETQLSVIAPLLFPDPLNDSEGQSLVNFKTHCEAEKAWLIDPYLFNPELLYKWEVKEIIENGEVKEIKVEIAARDNSPESTNAFEAAKSFLGLNREELCVLRGKTFRLLRAFAKTVLKIIPPEVDNQTRVLIEELQADAKQELLEMTKSSAPFAGMSRYFVKVVWNIDLS